VNAQQAASAVAIDTDDIGGVVRRPNKPEAGVWVIAETTGLPTTFARIVVTDEHPSDGSVWHGNELNVIRTVREFERAGLAGIRIED
jgi:hypothetical protein